MKPCMRWAAIGIAVLPLARASSQDSSFSVKDDIAMVRFSDPLPNHSIPGSENVRPSPDGRHFAVVTTKGLLNSDQIESDISIFDLKETSAFLNDATRQPPQPRVIAAIVSFPHREEANAYAPVIKDLRWSPDMTSVYFKGENSNGAYQLYVAKLDGSGFHALTPDNDSVGRFDVTKDLVVYTASQPSEDSIVHGESINSDSQVITGHSLIEVLFSGQLKAIAPETFTLSIMRATDGRWRTKQLPKYSVREIPYLSFLFPFAVSPKGHKLIGLTPVSTIPDPWKHYEPASGFEYKRFRAGDPRSTSVTLVVRPQQYSLIDLATGAIVPLVKAPNARVLGYPDNNRLAWAVDERRVLVTNTFLPLDERNDPDSPPKVSPCAVASVDLPSLDTRCLLFEESAPKPDDAHVQDASFGENNDEALVLVKRGVKDRAVQRYHLRNGEWSLTSSVPISGATDTLADLDVPKGSQRGGLQLSVRQSLNDPPTLWVSNSTTGKARQLWDPNPQFSHVRFGNASVYQWRDNTGYEWSGILVKPVGYVSGRRYPFVIQLYQFAEDEFLTDGLYPTAFAARHLASAGFVVLQIRKKPTTVTEADPRDHLDAYRSAVESLSQAGLIDRSRVGVVGFSWTCWYVVNALIKEPNLFAAATIADGLDNSYLQYVLFAVESSSLQQQMEKIRGTSPFGVGLKRWTEQAPGFHLDQVQTPVRIEAINPGSVLQEWELYSSLRMQNKPVDFIYFPHGTHIHQKPLERLESQQGDVDWFRFWLQGYEDPDPSKRTQYERWQKLRNDLHHSSTTATTNN